MDRVEIKKRARKIANENKWNIWKPMLIIALIEGVLLSIISLLHLPEVVASFLTSIVSIILIPASSFGMCAYTLKIARGEGADLSVITGQYKRYTGLLWITIICGVLIFLWSLLFIIPGIIASLAYSMYAFIAVENEDLEGKEVLDKSKEMMNGFKLDYLIFGLSFILWILSCVVIVPAIFVIPYIYIAMALYYDELVKKQAK